MSKALHIAKHYKWSCLQRVIHPGTNIHIQIQLVSTKSCQCQSANTPTSSRYNLQSTETAHKPVNLQQIQLYNSSLLDIPSSLLTPLQRNLSSSCIYNKDSQHSKITSEVLGIATDSRLEIRESEKETSSVEMDGYVVGHDSKNKMFYITLKAQTAVQKAILAKLEYVMLRPNLVDLWHTEVPPEFQGHGIAKILAKAAFDHFCEKEIRFRPSCTYLQKFLKDNPIPRYLDSMDKNFQ